jgi:putative flippase GtrA
MRPPAWAAPILRQAVSFGLIGVTATLVHVLVALAARHLAHLPPLTASFTGYLAAVSVSYFGNTFLTFGAAPWRRDQIVRFGIMSLAGLAVGQGIIWLLVTRLGLPFWVGLAGMVAVVPASSFAAARLWVFRPIAPPTSPR